MFSRLTAREAALQAVLQSLREQQFAEHALLEWKQAASPSDRDWRLATAIAFGSIKMRDQLDFVAARLAHPNQLRLKRRERALLHTALFQLAYLSRIPTHAVVMETVGIARRQFHPSVAGYLNQLLRKWHPDLVELPADNSVQSMALRYSYPEYLVGQLLDQYGEEATQRILSAGNAAPVTTARYRGNQPQTQFPPIEGHSGMVRLGSGAEVEAAASDVDYYIQNVTQAYLFESITQDLPPPHSVIDLCASPGGKMLLAADRWPGASLHANDLTEQKISRLQQNCERFGIEASVSIHPAESFPLDKRYHIVIADVPCSNSGVLGRRPEARWRLSKNALQQLQLTQHAILERAADLVEPAGALVYMTCSILQQENADNLKPLLAKGWTLDRQLIQLPNLEGWDGGYAALLFPPSRTPSIQG